MIIDFGYQKNTHVLDLTWNIHPQMIMVIKLFFKKLE